MKVHPILILVAVVAASWLFIHLAGACITLVGVGLGCEPGFAVVAGFLLAVGLAIYTLSKK